MPAPLTPAPTLQLEAELAGLKRLIVGSGSPLVAGSQIFYDADSGVCVVGSGDKGWRRQRTADWAAYCSPPSPATCPTPCAVEPSPAPASASRLLPPQGAAACPARAPKQAEALDGRFSAAAGGDENASPQQAPCVHRGVSPKKGPAPRQVSPDRRARAAAFLAG